MTTTTTKMVPVSKAPAKPGCSLFFQAISDVMSTAKRGLRLEADDLLLMHDSDDVRTQSVSLRISWDRELARYEADKAAYAALADDDPKRKKKPKLPSLQTACVPLVKPLWRISFVCYAFGVGLQFLGPYVLGSTVTLIEDTQYCALAETLGVNTTLQEAAEQYAQTGSAPAVPEYCRIPQIYMGYVFAAVMLVTKLLEAVVVSWSAHLMTRAALRARSGIVCLIYQKCLWLSGMGGDGATTGRIQNLMANDAQFFLQVAPMLNNMFLAPVQIVVAFIWLAFIIGPSFLAGLGVMFFSVPLQVRERTEDLVSSYSGWIGVFLCSSS